MSISYGALIENLSQSKTIWGKNDIFYEENTQKFSRFRSNLVLWSKIIEIGGDQFFARTLVIDLNGEWFRLKRDPGDIKFEWEWFTQYKTQNGMEKNTKIVQYQNRRSFILMSTDHWEKRHKWIYYDEVILIF